MNTKKDDFRLLMEYHSFLYYILADNDFIKGVKKFPSPYGVSFILILAIEDPDKQVRYKRFPSPYGVSFILMT